MKRFYVDVAIAEGAILLDGRPVRTPARAALVLPTAALAEAVAGEWRGQGDKIDPRAMPLTGLANAAIDQVAPDPTAFVKPLAAYAESDLLCYRAGEPADLVAAEAEAWDPLLAWAGARYDVHFVTVTGIAHAAQPASTVSRLGAALAGQDAFRLAGLALLVTIGGSIVTALGVAEGAISADAAFEATHLDELWQMRRWGEDHEATAIRIARRRDFLAAARFIALLV